MEEYSIYEIDFEKGNLKTLEGRKFAIDVFESAVKRRNLYGKGIRCSKKFLEKI